MRHEEIQKGLPWQSLGKLALKYGVEKKSDAVLSYIEEHKLYDKKRMVRGKAKYEGARFYEVPESIMVPYGFQDVITTYEIFKKQKETMSENKR